MPSNSRQQTQSEPDRHNSQPAVIHLPPGVGNAAAAAFTDPALHLLDMIFLMDVLRVLLCSRPGAAYPDEPAFGCLQHSYTQRINVATVIDQARILVFAEWVSKQLFQRGQHLSHEALVAFVMMRCEAAKVYTRRKHDVNASRSSHVLAQVLGVCAEKLVLPGHLFLSMTLS